MRQLLKAQSYDKAHSNPKGVSFPCSKESTPGPQLSVLMTCLLSFNNVDG